MFSYISYFSMAFRESSPCLILTIIMDNKTYYCVKTAAKSNTLHRKKFTERRDKCFEILVASELRKCSLLSQQTFSYHFCYFHQKFFILFTRSALRGRYRFLISKVSHNLTHSRKKQDSVKCFSL